ncbi:hypothetical protein PCANC_12002 [Puccinia coronata f. sp. avenae]|uniref:Uridylate kinase n=1 Tax=Puccinia coronata f. sp. avenae TaxID=200324 RepID=A0A2N5UUF7_9BASI|nr:hypothetical protein PCASD_20240 [Puccinia coronata f. sp. avenae]PLW41390.1 hypothetical protein PCANC_12002 [Puccinia coronata f. sp. avenae]
MSLYVCHSTLNKRLHSVVQLLQQPLIREPTRSQSLSSLTAAAAATENTRPRRSAPSPWLFLAILTASCSTFAYITHRRSLNDTDPRLRSKALPSFGGAPTLPIKVIKMPPVFDSKHVSVIFVLGGPGAGKGTQCARLVADYSFVHLSAGDLLRAEQNREGSTYGAMIKDHIREGKIVPMHVTIKLLEYAIRTAIAQGKSRFLVDGFPRQMDQAVKFDQDVCQSSFVLFLTCPEETLLQRLLERGKTSGREDDNEESIKKRFRTFIETSMPVVEYYEQKQKVVKVNSDKSMDEVYTEIRDAIQAHLPIS